MLASLLTDGARPRLLLAVPILVAVHKTRVPATPRRQAHPIQ
ncbi:hypothetical protein [Streptomyces sp. CB03234]|nr:hypothetical protein [Streptomyces sp. CB03234]